MSLRPGQLITNRMRSVRLVIRCKLKCFLVLLPEFPCTNNAFFMHCYPFPDEITNSFIEKLI